MSIWIFLIIAVGINIVGFIAAYRLRSDKLTDFSYGATFFILALIAFLDNPHAAAKDVGFAAVTIWSARLAGFLLLRILRNKKDKRFDGVREDFWKFGRFWLFQGVTAWLVLLPVLFMSNSRAGSINTLAIIGIIIWVIGLIVEAAADWQKFNFSQNPANKGRWIDEGLWHYSRHPNYFGEIMLWLGLYIFAFSYLNTGQRWWALVSPVYIAFLLIFVTGIPKLAESADQKWGKDQHYVSYKKRTSLLVPLPPAQNT